MFQYKTAAEIEAMTEYQREKYFDQKREHEQKEMQKAAEAAAKVAAAEAVKTEIEPLQTEIDSLKTANSEFKVKLDERDSQLEKAQTEMNRIKANEQRSQLKTLSNEIYEHFSTKEGEAMLANFVTEKARFNMELKNVNVKAVGTMAVPAGIVEPQIASMIGIAHEVIQARNIIPVSPTNSDVIKYVQFLKKDGKIGSVAAGQLKPQIDYVPVAKSAPVIKIAGWLTLQDEFLEDIAGARDFLAEELPKAYMDEETRQAFKGMGTDATGADELDGLYSKWAQNLILPNGTVTLASNGWDKLAAALSQVRRNLRASDAIWISPEDYKELLINKGNTLEYTYPVVSDTNGTLRIGGVPIFQHSVFLQGEGLVGDFRRGARFFQKKAMTIRTSTEHDVNFTHNLTTILIEGRVALPVFFPESFIKIDLTVGDVTP